MKHIKVIFILALMVGTLAVYAHEALAGFYSYKDSQGVTHITNDSSSIPEEYRATAVERQVNEKQDGYVPSLEVAQSSKDNGSDTWYCYEEMKWYERWIMLARASSLDIKPVLKSMAPWAGMVMTLLMILYFYIFKIFEAPAKKGMALFLVTGVAGTVIFYLFIFTVEKESEKLVSTVKKSTDSISENQQSLMDYLQFIQHQGQQSQQGK